MFDKDKILFSLVGLIGDDDMLFPDWGNRQNVVLGGSAFYDKSYTVPQDSFIIFYYDSENSYIKNLTVDGQNLFYCAVGQLSAYDYYPHFYCRKGTVINYTKDVHTALFSVFPLVKLGGGLKSYYCLLKAQPKVLFFVTGE